jgi:hypothetical protein
VGVIAKAAIVSYNIHVGKPGLHILSDPTDLVSLQLIAGSENTRALEISTDCINSVPTDESTQDALNVDPFQMVFTPESFESAVILAAIESGIRRNAVKDERGSVGGGKGVGELFKTFERRVREHPLMVAQNRKNGEYVAYVIREKYVDRFVLLEIAEQLMIQKRRSRNGFVVENFLRQCKQNGLVNDVILAMMIHKAYRQKERREIITKLGISLEVHVEVEEMLSKRQWSTTERVPKIETRIGEFVALQLKHQVPAGKYDNQLLAITPQPIYLAIAFRFNSLLSETRERLQQSYLKATGTGASSEYVEAEIALIQDASSKDMADFLCTDHVALVNKMIPLPRPWLPQTSLDSAEGIIEAAIKYYPVHQEMPAALTLAWPVSVEV